MNWERKIRLVLAWAFYALFFVTPLLFNPNRNYPSFELFEWNKMFFVYILTTIITGTWICRMILHKKIIFIRTPPGPAIILFLLSQILATVFSIDPHVSIFGYYSRFHGGLLSTICYTLLYFAFVSNRDVIRLKRLFLFIISSACVVALYAIAEKFGIDANMWVQDVRSRVFSTFGQPNWLAAYLAIILPITIAQFFMKPRVMNPDDANESQNTESKSTYLPNIIRRAVRQGYLISAIIFYTSLLFTKSRSGFLGFWIPNLIIWVGVFYTYRQKLNTVRLFLILNSLFLALNFFIKTPIPAYNRLATIEIFNRQQVVEEIQAPMGDSVINVGITDSAKIRQVVWKGAVDIVKAYPLLGTGPETFAYAYYKFRPQEHNLTSEWDFLYNRAHNEFLNIAATSGITGLVTYLFFIAITYLGIYKSWRRTATTPTEKIILLALAAAYTSIHV
ncbi:MAG: O-antigen ligase family protein, partial [Patescibacteria group bacterium]